MALLDQYGRPVKTAALAVMQAEPGLTGIRQIWSGSVASGLTPQRLAGILSACDQGDLDSFLTLAEEMEERDPHYASVLGIRKRVISGKAPVVKAASGSAADKRIAEAVEAAIALSAGFGDLVEDLLDALGKGFAVVEINWQKTAREWRPAEFIYRDQRWFQPDRATGRELRLKDEAAPVDGIPLLPFKFIQHRAALKSGLFYRAGLARLVAFAWMCKNYTVKDWMAFVETYGLPLRLGRYGKDATAKDIDVLFRAVANIGSDAAAVLPEHMRIEFENGPAANSDKVFENLARYIDEQVSKAVLGQTMTADNGSSEAQANVHNEVRHDIASADARAVTATINRDLVKPYVDLNFGVQAAYPVVSIEISEPEDVTAKIANAKTLHEMGVELSARELRAVAGFSDPQKGDEIVGGKIMGGADHGGAALSRNRRCGCGHCDDGLSLNTQTAEEEDEIDEIATLMRDDWSAVAIGLLEAVVPSVEQAGSYQEVLDALPEALTRMPTALAVETLVKGMFMARALGDVKDG